MILEESLDVLHSHDTILSENKQADLSNLNTCLDALFVLQHCQSWILKLKHHLLVFPGNWQLDCFIS
jgi:hypothetical protein